MSVNLSKSETLIAVPFALCALSLSILTSYSQTSDSTAQIGKSTIPVAAASPHEFNDCSGAAWCPQMVLIPAGSFTMGSPPDEPGRNPDEQQQSRTIAHPFAVGKYAVTRLQWAAFVAATHRPVATGDCAYAPAKQPSWLNPGFPQDDSHPVVCVTWGEAQDYAAWLSQRTGKAYRLLTESEREYAARAGSTTPFPWGATASHEYANYGADKCCAGLKLGRDKWEFTAPVGSFPPNAFGLHDMHGNVLEWVQDCYAEAYLPAKADGSAYESPACKLRVARGAAYADWPDLLRSASRNYAPPPDDKMTILNYRSAGFGLRVARSLP